MNPLARLRPARVTAQAQVKQDRPGGDGLACIATILKAASADFDVRRFKARNASFKSGMTLRQMMEIFETHGFSTRALHCPRPDLAVIALPCVLHWDLRRFVLLMSIDAAGYSIFDPATGLKTLDADVVDHHFNDVVLEVRPVQAESRQAGALVV